MQHSFSIIIVTWNGLRHLKRFLPSVLKTDYPDFEIIIADNASSDGTAEWIKEQAPGCKVVTFDANYGYCGGNNRAVAYATGEILLFLNNDVRVDPNWLSPINGTFSDKDVAAVQPKLRSHRQPDLFEYAGAAGGYIDWLGYPFCKGRLFDSVEQDTGQYDTPSPILWASGAALAVRKDLFITLGGFDENFEFHMEEIDLCWRIWKSGAGVFSQPESVVYHLGGGSMPMDSPRKVYYNFRNSLMMLTKNLDRFVFPKLFLRLLLDGVAGVRALVQLKPLETLSIIKAHFGFYRKLPAVLNQRRSFRKTQAGGAPVYQKLIIWQYYMNGVKRYSDLPDVHKKP